MSFVMRDEIVQAADRQNISVVSVRLSKRDVERLQALAEQFGVGVSTYIRVLVREHLESRGDAAGPFDRRALAEVAAARAPEA